MSLTPSAARIVEAAIENFAVRGYDGASLSEIADTVGLRKASLYAHFDSKDSLFMAAFDIAVARERARAAECFAGEHESGLPGMHYCEDLLARYPDTPSLQFFLRCSYMSAHGLGARIDALHEAYLSQLRDDFLQRLGARDAEHAPDWLAEVYLGLVDSLQVKLIYTTPALAATRLSALQQLLRAALQPAHTA